MFDTMTLTKIVGSLCGALLIFLLGNWAAEALYNTSPGHSEEEGHAQAYVIDTGAEEGGEGEGDSGPTLAELWGDADVEKGAKVFGKCKACHKLEDGANATGPYLYGVVGRDVAAVGDFGYSGSLAPVADVWTPENLSAFLENPKGYAPGTSMGFAGLKDIEDRVNLIAYLDQTDGDTYEVAAPEPAAEEGAEETAAAEEGADEEAAAEDGETSDGAAAEEEGAAAEEGAAEGTSEGGEEAAEGASEEPAAEDTGAAEEVTAETPDAAEVEPSAEAEAEAEAATETEEGASEEEGAEDGAADANTEDAAAAEEGATEEAADEDAATEEGATEEGSAEDGAAEEGAAEEGASGFAAMVAEADVATGEKVFKKCKACHALEDGQNRVGPHLYGLVDRPVASVEGFSYSDALAGIGGEWTVDQLSAFLEKPKEFAPGTKMSFAGLRKEEDRAAVIAFIESAAQ